MSNKEQITQIVKNINSELKQDRAARLADKCINDYLNTKIHSSKTPLLCNDMPANRCDVLNIPVENKKYIDITTNILQNAKSSYTGFLITIDDYKNNIVSLRNQLQTMQDNSNTTVISGVRNDNLIDLLYNSSQQYLTVEIIDSKQQSSRALFDLSGANTLRSVSHSYFTCDGIVINNCIAKIDNIALTNSSLYLSWTVGGYTFIFPKAMSFAPLTIISLIDALLLTESNIAQLENEMSKNINIINAGLMILDMLKNNI